VAAVLVGLVIVARVGVLTPWGRALVESQLDHVSVGRYGHLHAEGLDGDIWGDFSVRQLTIVDGQGAWATGNSVRIRWDWSRLLGRTLAIDEAAKRCKKIRENGRGRDRRGSFECVGQEQVARQDTDRVAPDAARCKTPPALLPVIDYVIVKQGRQMDELGRDGEIANARGWRSETCGGEHDGQRPDPLATGFEQMRRRVGGR